MQQSNGMNFNKFFFLHINQTTAKTLGIRMMNRLYDVLEQNGIHARALNSNHGLHNTWRNVDNETFIFSTIREPIDFCLSRFCYFMNYHPDGTRKHSYPRDRDFMEYRSEDFINWVNNHMVDNYQARIISGYGCNYYDGDLDVQKFNNNLARINMLIKTETIKHNENILRNKILSHFNIVHAFPYYPPDYETVYMPTGEFSKLLEPIIKTNPQCMNTIKEKNAFDLIAYNQAKSAFDINSA